MAGGEVRFAAGRVLIALTFPIAQGLAQGTTPVGVRSALLDSALIEEVAAALQVIRTAVPDLREAITDRDATSLQIELRPAAGRRGRLAPNGAP